MLVYLCALLVPREHSATVSFFLEIYEVLVILPRCFSNTPGMLLRLQIEAVDMFANIKGGNFTSHRDKLMHAMTFEHSQNRDRKSVRSPSKKSEGRPTAVACAPSVKRNDSDADPRLGMVPIFRKN